MRIGSGEHTYDWVEPWAQIPDTESARLGWAHPGMAVDAANRVFTFHQGDPTVLVFDQSGNLLRTIDTELTEGHGICLTVEDGVDYLWIADNGSKRYARNDYGPNPPADGQVVKLDLAGRVVLTLERPDLPVYREGRYSPTAVAVNEERHGGNGDVWVADGYGQSHVHRYSRFDKRGQYVASINGQEGPAGPFACPHNIWFDARKAEPELYIADRTNNRIQVYDAEGRFKRAFGADFLIRPSAFAGWGDCLFVAELNARVSVLDRDDRLVCHLGANVEVSQTEGWPNAKDERGRPTRTHRLEIGRFNSPHGIAADSAGNVYVAEWLIGGRTIKLVRAG